MHLRVVFLLVCAHNWHVNCMQYGAFACMIHACNIAILGDITT